MMREGRVIRSDVMIGDMDELAPDKDAYLALEGLIANTFGYVRANENGTIRRIEQQSSDNMFGCDFCDTDAFLGTSMSSI